MGASWQARGSRLWQAWGDLSLRTKLLLFALVLVTVPGGVFALVAFSGARAALEREVGIQLQQTAERGAEAVAAALERAQSDARSWAQQDVMRDLLVGDLDKRVSKFLQTVTGNKTAYLAALCVDAGGSVMAASSGEWIGRDIHAWPAANALRNGKDALVGPIGSADLRREVLQIGVAVRNPDPPGEQIGSLILLYDWSTVGGILDGIRAKLAALGKRVAAIIVDRDGAVNGGVSFDGRPAWHSTLAAADWRDLPRGSFAARSLRAPNGRRDAVLAGGAPLLGSTAGWSVIVVEHADEALAPVRGIRTRWLVMSACILVVALAVAALLARQFMRPLDEVTRATSRIAAHPDHLALPLLPVRSRNEVGQLTASFNIMTTELKRSQDEALSAAKFAFAGELAAMVAHEVRTPLSVMRSSAQMLADPKPACTVDPTELVNTIVAEVDRVERVVSGLIQLARPLEQRLVPTVLRDVLSRAAEFAAAHAERQHIQITCDFANGQSPALCDPEQTYQVVLNLLVNAVQALPQGGRIWLRTLDEVAGSVGFEVVDDGPGIPREIRDRIFRPFITGREDGTGLGLAFVERVVKAHRGNVSLRSEPGRGTVFEIRLPMAANGV